MRVLSTILALLSVVWPVLSVALAFLSVVWPTLSVALACSFRRSHFFPSL
ncbi:hypothetical protein [Lysinibacillus xylanilyticus]|uniref:Uncharacterized protein n=1 Tax=Lysinibacillus xylanilyticus TaxID=582475 RepID=A0ABV3VQY8_9BACI